MFDNLKVAYLSA